MLMHSLYDVCVLRWCSAGQTMKKQMFSLKCKTTKCIVVLYCALWFTFFISTPHPSEAQVCKSSACMTGSFSNRWRTPICFSSESVTPLHQQNKMASTSTRWVCVSIFGLMQGGMKHMHAHTHSHVGIALIYHVLFTLMKDNTLSHCVLHFRVSIFLFFYFNITLI